MVHAATPGVVPSPPVAEQSEIWQDVKAETRKAKAQDRDQAIALSSMRVPTERIVLLPGSSRATADASLEKVSRRRPLSLVFGAAFGVGVLCTLAGQVVLHSREKQKIVDASALSATAPLGNLNVVPSAAPEAPATARVAGELLGGEALVAERNIKPPGTLETRDFAVPVAVGSDTGIGMRKSKGRNARRAKGGGSSSGPSNHASAQSGARWIDPFAADAEVAPATEKSDPVNRQEKAQAARPDRGQDGQQGWSDPFAK